jgi:very-short-patch-repair endonuclease
MRPDRALRRLGGFASLHDLLALTSRAQLRSAVRHGLVERHARGRYALPGADEAIGIALSLAGVLDEDSAARFHGWETKHPPSTPCVAVPRKRSGIGASRITGVRLRYRDIPPHDVSGAATTPGETVLRCAARLPFDEALAVADSALRHGDVSRRGLLDRAELMPARYRARCLRVVQRSDGRAANPFESVLRAIALDVPGLSVEPQVWIDPVGQPDLLDAERRVVIEADSYQYHGHRAALRRDCERYNAFVVLGYEVLRFSYEHVYYQPDYVRAVLRAAVGQPDEQALGGRTWQRPA